MIKMLVVDIDGTILGKTLKLTENLKKCFKILKQQGVKVVLATGRMYYAAIHLARELELETPIISYQGGYIKNFAFDDKVLYEKLISSKDLFNIIDIVKQEKIHLNVYAEDKLFVEQDNDIIKNYCVDRKIPYKVVENFQKLNFIGYNKLLAIDYDSKKIDLLMNKLKNKYSDKFYICRSTPYFCEVSNKEATKGLAIKFLSNLWNIKKNEIMAIGDQDNDIDMLQSAGIKIAMGNASAKLKEIADFVTLDVENDGVCLAVEKYIFEGEKIEI